MIQCNLASLDKSTILGLPLIVAGFSQLWVDGFGASDSMGNLHLLGLCISRVSLIFIILIVILVSSSLRLGLNLP